MTEWEHVRARRPSSAVRQRVRVQRPPPPSSAEAAASVCHRRQHGWRMACQVGMQGEEAGSCHGLSKWRVGPAGGGTHLRISASRLMFLVRSVS